MDLSEKFALVASGVIVRINTLEEGRRYAVTFAQRLETQYGQSVLLTLRVDSDSNVKVFLPKRYTEVFREENIEHINNGTRSYKLVCNGRYPGSRGSYKLRLEY